jgi:hypothetical protein
MMNNDSDYLLSTKHYAMQTQKTFHIFLTLQMNGLKVSSH